MSSYSFCNPAQGSWASASKLESTRLSSLLLGLHCLGSLSSLIFLSPQRHSEIFRGTPPPPAPQCPPTMAAQNGQGKKSPEAADPTPTSPFLLDLKQFLFLQDLSRALQGPKTQTAALTRTTPSTHTGLCALLEQSVCSCLRNTSAAFGVVFPEPPGCLSVASGLSLSLYTRTHRHTHTHTHTHKCSHTHSHIHTTHVYTLPGTGKCTYIYFHKHTYTLTYTHTNANTHKCTHTHIHSHFTASLFSCPTLLFHQNVPVCGL
jgi:hypothetical protein